MIRRLSTKWILAVLAVVILPFLGFAWYVDSFVSQRFSDDVVRYHLLGHAAELSERLDRLVDERRRDARLLATVPQVPYSLTEWGANDAVFTSQAEQLFDQLVGDGETADFVIGIGVDGTVEVASTIDSGGRSHDAWTRSAIRGDHWAQSDWFSEALETGSALLDPAQYGLIHPDVDVPIEARYHFGFAFRVMGHTATYGAVKPLGVVVTFVPWTLVQDEVSSYGVRRRNDQSAEMASQEIYDSTYAWVWASDSDTILAHPKRELYGMRVSEEPVNLPQMVEAARSARSGLYPDYEFGGMKKKAAFRHGREPNEAHFGWVVGVGVDYQDIYGPIHAITATIAKASTAVLLIAILVTVIVARRTTRPVQDLEAFTRRVASGDLDAQVPVRGHDELADLARSFNRMTHELKENRAQLVEAEKDAAWREMARQVAHEIKNPLTPIQLSTSLLKRAYDEGSREFPSILDRTIEVVQRQVRNMRDIAQDFYRFAGEHRDPVPVDAARILDEVLDLNEGWAESEGVELVRAPQGSDEPFTVLADPDELRRAFVNLVSNAFEAMEGAGRLEATVEREAGSVWVHLQDSGKGISDEVQERLFEPYFTTRSSGTGLGLAIVRRIVEDLGGEVRLVNAEGGSGAVASIRLPAHG